ncbi:hypothetical protein DdX_05987 [Ditylenchus destructor]|uniref:Uncharacterized protein n=1 Tax=Ditylenchus destructor TaxID=166010 RepID=A0AAD4NBY3_9BILA|nr:hypothetical protein DdX_05987 [Ditylenchus destructor]
MAISSQIASGLLEPSRSRSVRRDLVVLQAHLEGYLLTPKSPQTSHPVNAISRRRIQEMPNRASLKPASRFRAAHASFRLRMLQEQHAPATEPFTTIRKLISPYVGHAQQNIFDFPSYDSTFVLFVVRIDMKDKEKKIQKRLGHRFHAIQSDPSSPAVTRDTAPAPLDLSRVLSGSQRKKLSMIKMSTPPQTPTSLSVDTAVETILKKQQIIRTASGGSQNSGLLKKRSSAGDDASSLNLLPSLNPAGANNQAEGLSSSSVLYSPVAGTSFGYGMHPHVSPRNSAPSHKSSAVITTGVFSPGPASVFSPGPGTATMTFPTPKSYIINIFPNKTSVLDNSRKFKMAHESFRIRMFQEQYGFEPVFMTKKRTADSKFSEFKGGDLNKYTAQSYTIKNGNEIFGDELACSSRPDHSILPVANVKNSPNNSRECSESNRKAETQDATLQNEKKRLLIGVLSGKERLLAGQERFYCIQQHGNIDTKSEAWIPARADKGAPTHFADVYRSE